jgi:hypothetical protein
MAWWEETIEEILVMAVPGQGVDGSEAGGIADHMNASQLSPLEDASESSATMAYEERTTMRTDGRRGSRL